MVKGVQQGSILGPLLFTIFMDDLPSVIENCNLNLYADDTNFSSKDPQKVGSYWSRARSSGPLGQTESVEDKCEYNSIDGPKQEM